MSLWFTQLPDLSAQGISCLWRATWQGSIGFLIVWLICGLVPRIPARFQCWLWRLALVKLLVVLLWRVPLALPLLPAATELPAPAAAPMVTVPTADAVAIPSASSLGGVATSGTNGWLPALLTVLFVAWLAGAGWQAFRLFQGWLAMRRFRRSCRTLVSEELTRHLHALCKTYAVRRPPLLLVQEGIGSPLLLGVLHPAIVIPSALLTSLGAEQCRMALAHELAHVKRRDLAWSLVAALVRVVFVFHPLVWWASWRLDVAQEIAADQFVLTGFGKQLGAYAAMLLAVTNQPQPYGLAPLWSAGTLGRYQTLKRRITAMKSFHPASRSVVAASIILILLGATLGIVPWRLVAADAPPSAVPPASAPTSVAKSVTVFPIVLNSGAPIPGVSPDMSKNLAELVGLILERGGMKEIEIAEAKFVPPQEADLAKAAEAFAQFVKTQNLKTEYAFFGQFFGMPGKGVDEIRVAIVDRQGKVAFTDRLDRQQLLTGGVKKVDPMLACSNAVNQVRGFWGLANPDEANAPQGKMAKLWAEKSSLPPAAEREAMQARLKAMKQSLKTNTVAVFVRGAGPDDPKAAEALAAMLTQDGLGQAHAAEQAFTFQAQPSTNQLRTLWDTARAFQDFLRKTPPSADYALLAAYGIGHSPDGKTVVGGVNLIVCNRAGEWVLVGLQNDDHPEFQRINPQSTDDCNRLVVEMLKKELAPRR